MDDLLGYIRTLTVFSDESWEVLQRITVKVTFEKGTFLVAEGKFCQSLFYISKGYCRAYQLQDGVEVNTNFYFEKEIVTNINSYVKNEKSTFAIQACEPVVAYRFDKSLIAAATKISPEIEKVGKLNLQLIAARLEKQLELFRLLSAKQRYDYLQKNHPQMLQRISLTQLSSYLGIARETLSRVRRQTIVRL